MTQLPPPAELGNRLELPWSWCPHCQRAYVKGTYREFRFAPDARHRRATSIRRCPYPTCSGSTGDSYRWETVLLWHPDYPQRPQQYVIYGA